MDCPADKIVFDPQRAEYICTETGEVIEEKVPVYVDNKVPFTTIKPQYDNFNIGTLRENKPENKFVENGITTRNTFSYIIHAISKLGLPKEVEVEASILYRNVIKKMDRIRSKKYIASACIFMIIRDRYPITIKEFAEKLELDIKKLSKYLKKVQKYTNKKPDYEHEIKLFILRLITELSLPFYIQQEAIDIAVKLARHTSKKAYVVAASAVYVSLNKHNISIPLTMYAKMVKVTPDAIKKVVSSMLR